MAIQLPNLTLWADRIESACPLVKRTGEAADLAVALIDGPAGGAPAAFVMPADETTGEANLGLGSMRQRVTLSVEVAILIENRANPSGEAAIDDLEAVRTEIFEALLNWAPEAIVDPITYQGGNLVSMDGAELWWVDSFSTTYFLRKT